MATGTTLSLTQLTFANGSVLKSTDITGSTFNTTVSLPAIHAASLVDNLVFQDVIILPGSLSNGQVATLAPLGQSGTQRYIFNATTGNFTIGAGATLTIQPEARVVAVETNGTTFGIVVNGVLNVADAFLTHTGTNNSSTIAVGAGGRLTATNSQIAWSKVNLNSGGAADFQFDTFTTKLTINSGAGANIFNNDFSTNGANGVIAAGSSSATINFENNYWGSDPAAIPAMIQDNADNATLPTIDFSPNLTTPPFPFFNPTSLNLSTSGEGVSRTLTAAPGTGPATNFAVASGALPTGMALSSGGVLNGTPIAVGSYVFTVSADDFAPGVGNFVANQH
jgi:hypothetical protein